jgi:hypothetical protein
MQYMFRANTGESFQEGKGFVKLELPEPWRERVKGARTVNEIMRYLQSHFSMKVGDKGMTNCKLAARNVRFGAVEFGILWAEKLAEREHISEQLIVAWIHLLHE